MNRLSQNGEDELLETRQTVQTLAEETAIALKKNVYKNYSQFIETAKEISSILGHEYAQATSHFVSLTVTFRLKSKLSSCSFSLIHLQRHLSISS